MSTFVSSNIILCPVSCMSEAIEDFFWFGDSSNSSDILLSWFGYCVLLFQCKHYHTYMLSGTPLLLIMVLSYLLQILHLLYFGSRCIDNFQLVFSNELHNSVCIISGISLHFIGDDIRRIERNADVLL